MHPTKSVDNKLLFYDIINSPIPDCEEFFYYKQKNGLNSQKTSNPVFSWSFKPKIMQEYIDYIDKYGRVYKSLPFVKDIFLVNSITFNNLNKKSDIDIVIISKAGKLWRTRFWSVLFFWILGLKRNQKDFSKKFCLSFYIDEKVLNIGNIRQKGEDVFFHYRVSHYVKLYQEKENNDFYIQNERVSDCLPNYQKKQQIFIGNKFFNGKTNFKKIIEFLLKNKFGNFLQKMIKYFWLPIVIYKKNKLGKKGENIIISDNILKFYNDKRGFLNLLFHKKSQR